MTTDPDLIVCDIIQNQLGLDSQHIWAYDENIEAPKDSGIYVVVSTGTQKTIGVSSIYNPSTQQETQSISVAQELFIDITSKDRTALQRKEEVLMALGSVYSEQSQETNGVKITRGSNPLDLSFIEAASALHRYRISCFIFYVKTKTVAVSYFDQFPLQGALIQNG